jgi:bla regulator protein blaR1
MNRLLVVPALAAVWAFAAVAQEPLPSFEVASVRVNKSGEMGARIQRQPGGRMNAVNMPLRDLIQFAYQVRPFQIDGAPEWTRTTRYDITAKAEIDLPLTPPGSGPAPEMLMLRSLLADSFKLPVYELKVAREDGKLGPNLRPSTTDCQALMKAAMGRGGGPPPGGSPDAVMCGIRIGPGRLNAGSMPLSELANTFGVLVQRTVVDRTGLSGLYDADLRFTAEALPGPGGLAPPPGVAAPPADPDAPSLFTAIQEQLGLKLDSARGPVQVLVIDHVEPAVDD